MAARLPQAATLPGDWEKLCRTRAVVAYAPCTCQSNHANWPKLSLITRRFLLTSAPTRSLDRRDIDFLHVHHGIERPFCFTAPGCHRLHQHPWRDLPGNSPFVFAPAARTLLAVIAHDRVPVAVGLSLILSRDLERE